LTDYKPINCTRKVFKHLQCGLFEGNFFQFKCFGAGAAPEALDGITVSHANNACLVVVAAAAGDDFGPPEDSIFPGAVLVEPNNGSTVTVGMS
jgi:hypothetical protein